MGRPTHQPAHPKVGMDLHENRTSFRRRHRWLPWLAGSLFLGLSLLAIVVNIVAHRAEPFVRERVVRELSERFHARVELDVLRLSPGNSLHGEWGIWAEGRGLRIWPPAAAEGADLAQSGPPMQPLIELADFRFHAPLRYRSGSPIHIRLVRLRGLEIRFPPKSRIQRALPGAEPAGTTRNNGDSAGIQFQIDTVDCSGAHVEIQTDKPGKLPLEFVISHFKVTDLRPGQPVNFEADLTNPKPPGQILATGSFGPWNTSDPSESPVKGDYRFNRADLSVFKGIAGILHSTGQYQGTLRNMTVDGETDTPDFQLSHFGNKVALHTNFHARVDGTNGDTWLEPVDGTIGQSHFIAQGKVARVLVQGDGGKLQSIGHDIALDVTVDRARLEDFLNLASRSSTPILTGDVNLKVLLHIPPGPAPVHDRMTLKGQFALNGAEFTSLKVQSRIRELSLRGQGRPDDLKSADSPPIKSQMQGDFQFGSGLLKLPALTYKVPGADIELHGEYSIGKNLLDFNGIAKLQATVSEAVGGWKGMLLKPADRLFKKDGAGAEIPIYISGPREKPHFGFDSERLTTTHPQSPGSQD
jgi:AsmA-like C-terminal region